MANGRRARIMIEFASEPCQRDYPRLSFQLFIEDYKHKKINKGKRRETRISTCY